jgi:hypothetical protein
MNSIFSALHDKLQWPSAQEIFKPSGAGPEVYAGLVRQKLEEPIQRRTDGREVRFGVLTGNPSSDETEPPIAIVCSVPKALSNTTLGEIHRLSWNFCRSPLLIVVEPHQIRVWSCYEVPKFDHDSFSLEPVEHAGLKSMSDIDTFLEGLHWIYLASGHFLSTHKDRFPYNQRADKRLLSNLKFVRRKLAHDIPENVVHDLLARLIFIQFLFQRKDSTGNPALNDSQLTNLNAKGILLGLYSSLSEILINKRDTYALFEWLDDRFNGDMFPDDWEQEKLLVTQTHLNVLSQFIKGDMQMEDGQLCLWPLYSFDALPLEFISSIYEEFVKGQTDNVDNRDNRDEAGSAPDDEDILDGGGGEHYTPLYLVDFMLDKVLPWNGVGYELKILDPACGSGAFLVKVFQRLVHRWRKANAGKEPTASFLRSLIEQYLFGIDIEPRAIAVASFSLYLAMCDEIDPRHYWTQVRFPKLRGITLQAVDFFSEDVHGISTTQDLAKYDLVIGNAPWGEKTVTPAALKWATNYCWKIADKQIGTLFLPKAAALTKKDGRVCMIQPASTLLFNRSPTSTEMRSKFFATYKVEEVANLSALRFSLGFASSTSPSCIITFCSFQPDGEPFAYWCPKETVASKYHYRIIIDSQDLNFIYPNEAQHDPYVWSALTWGGRRDLGLIKRLRTVSKSLASAVKDGAWKCTRGFQRGKDQAKLYADRLGLRVLVVSRVWGLTNPTT